MFEKAFNRHDHKPTDYIFGDDTISKYVEKYVNRINSYQVLDITVNEIDLVS